MESVCVFEMHESSACGGCKGSMGTSKRVASTQQIWNICANTCDNLGAAANFVVFNFWPRQFSRKF
jgi:hypothetical protein